jgi:hypothetical protein
MKRFLRRTFLVLLALFVLIQLVPYGRDHSNPPGRVEPAWAGAETRELARRACFDCHSNETVWPWYSYVAPVSWLVQRDVDRARAELNFSEWGRPQDEAKEAAEMVRKRKMPLSYYLPLHPEARLGEEETMALADGLEATVAAGGGGGAGEVEEHGGEEID